MIPRISNGDLMKDIREQTINPLVNLVNEHEVENEAQNELIAANKAAISTYTQEIVNIGGKCVVDHRIHNFSTTGQFAGIGVDLEANEFPVRAATRNFDTAAKKGEFIPVASISYDRNTKTLTASTNGVKDGQLFVEYWKVI